MPTYMVRLIADSSVRLSEKPYLDTPRVPLSVTLSGLFTVTVVDSIIMMADVTVPKGLVINVQVDADDLNSGIDHAQQAATYLLSMMSCVCNASVMPPKPLWAYDATPGLTERDLTVFAYDLNVHMAARPVDRVRLLTVLEHKLGSSGSSMREFAGTTSRCVLTSWRFTPPTRTSSRGSPGSSA